MFTGIIEEVGEIKSFTKHNNGATIEVLCTKVLESSNIGDSIAINGCCQTVTELKSGSFCANVSNETLSVTTFSHFKPKDKVNLERALRLDSRLGGHIVSGHVDCRGKFIRTQRFTNFYDLEFEIPQEQEKYIVHKGSITINGISLTVAKINDNVVKCAIIPHTYNNTTLKDLNEGDFVNIETDILGKYVEKMLSPKDNKSSISLEFLQENGFV